MNFFTMNGVPRHFSNWNFPGFFDEGEAHVAWCIAENDVGVGPYPTEVEQALIEKLLVEIHTRCPQIRPEHLETGFRRACEYVMELDRAHLVGPPLRLAWFRLSYYLGLSVFADAGRAMPEGTSRADARHLLIRTMRELGIEATEADLDVLSQMFQLKRQDDADGGRERFSLGVREGTMLHYLRFLHLTAVRHQAVVRMPYSLGKVSLVFATADAKKAEQAQTYLKAHAVVCVEDLAEAQAAIAFLSRVSARDAAFWARLATAKQSGCRPIVLLDCPRSELRGLERSVPGAFAEVFRWVIQTAIVEYVPDNQLGFISLLRGLEPGTRWWWGEDAIPEVMASDGFELFDGAYPKDHTGGITDIKYPGIFDKDGIEAGVALAERVYEGLDPAERAAPASHRRPYLESIVALMDTRTTFDHGFFRLPWLMVGYHLTSRLLAVSEFGSDTPWHPADLDPLAAALHGLGLHSKHGDIPEIVEQLLAIDWPQNVDEPAGRVARVEGFSRLVIAFSDMALAAYSKTRFVVPLYASFVSYAAPEQDLANTLAKTIEQTQTAEVWFDRRAVAVGSQLTEALKTGIDQSERLVLLASAAAADSDFVQLEAEYAAEQGVPIIVLPVGDTLDARWGAEVARRRDQGLAIDVLPVGLDAATAIQPTIEALTRSPAAASDWVAAVVRGRTRGAGR